MGQWPVRGLDAKDGYLCGHQAVLRTLCTCIYSPSLSLLSLLFVLSVFLVPSFCCLAPLLLPTYVCRSVPF